MLIEKPEIILWRGRYYLTKVQRMRAEGKKIYYIDETWINAGHTKPKIWNDESIRQAFSEGLSTGLKNPHGKGKRLIISHIGSDSGFIEGADYIFESKSTKDYHEEMDGARFKSWIQKILPFLEPNSIIITDNAPYHSVKVNRRPNASWNKKELTEWLQLQGVDVDATLLKLELLDISKNYIYQAIQYPTLLMVCVWLNLQDEK